MHLAHGRFHLLSTFARPPFAPLRLAHVITGAAVEHVGVFLVTRLLVRVMIFHDHLPFPALRSQCTHAGCREHLGPLPRLRLDTVSDQRPLAAIRGTSWRSPDQGSLLCSS